MNADKRALKDVLYEFLQNPTRENFVELVLKGTGEQNNIDFKGEWIKEEKIAEIMLGIANSGGGVIIIGVKENKEDKTIKAAGIEKIVDKAVICRKIDNFLPDTISYSIHDFDYSGEEYSKMKNKKFQVIFIESEDEKLPYVWNKGSGENAIGVVFIRKGTNTDRANNAQLQRLIDKRILASYHKGSSLELEEHLKQLKVLYENIRRNKVSFNVLNNHNVFGNVFARIEANENYPNESYEQFINRMIQEKKYKIEKVLDLK